MGLFFHNHFQMADGNFREFVVRDDPVWTPYNRAAIEGRTFQPWEMLTKEIALRNAGEYPPDGEFITAAEFEVGAEIPAEDWDAEQIADVILTATEHGFIVRDTGIYWPMPVDEK